MKEIMINLKMEEKEYFFLTPVNGLEYLAIVVMCVKEYKKTL
jgi:hypothetical protein